MMAVTILGFIACLSLTALSVYGLVVMRKFDKQIAEQDALNEKLRKRLEEWRNG